MFQIYKDFCLQRLYTVLIKRYVKVDIIRYLWSLYCQVERKVLSILELKQRRVYCASNQFYLFLISYLYFNFSFLFTDVPARHSQVAFGYQQEIQVTMSFATYATLILLLSYCI